jgi:hypothetical protein
MATAQPDLFLAAISDAPFRDGLDLMSVPVASLAKSRRVEPIVYRRGDVSVDMAPPSAEMQTDPPAHARCGLQTSQQPNSPVGRAR